MFSGKKSSKEVEVDAVARASLQKVRELFQISTKDRPDNKQSNDTLVSSLKKDLEEAIQRHDTTKISKLTIDMGLMAKDLLEVIAVEHNEQILSLLNSLMQYDSTGIVDQISLATNQLGGYLNQKDLNLEKLKMYLDKHKELIPELKGKLESCKKQTHVAEEGVELKSLNPKT